MKFIGHLNALSAFRESLEEYQPEGGSNQRDIVELVRARYNFQGFPVLRQGGSMPPALIFTGGKFAGGAAQFAIQQLIMLADGDVAMATTTEQTDTFLDDLIGVLDDELGFRLRMSKIKKSHVSNVVVEFDTPIEVFVPKLTAIANIINDFVGGQTKGLLNIKRIGFGTEDSGIPSDPITTIERGEFQIERRAGRPFSENRYYCTAPLKTEDHLRALEQIEKVLKEK